MAIFKYTFKKYLKAPSTWVILLFSMFIAGFLGGYLPMSALDTTKKNVSQNYGILILAIGGGITTFLAIFMSVFAGFKGASMFRDEVEDGTFLVMLSKPQSRAKIILQKWMALQVLMLCYSFLSIVSFVIFVEIFDKGNSVPNLVSMGIGTLRDNVIKMAGFIWAVLIVIGLIFSSIAILLSTKLSGGATVGISISLGVIIPITGMVAMFTTKKDYTNFKSATFNRMGLMLDTMSKSSDEDMDKLISSLTEQKLGKTDSGLQIDSLISAVKGLIRKSLGDMDKSYNVINSPDSIYNSVVANGETNKFKSAWPFDLNYQLRQMSTVVTNNMIPSALKPQLSIMKSAGIAGINMEQKVIGTPKIKNGETLNWIHDQIETIMKTQFKWGMAAKELLSKVLSIVPIQKTDGTTVPNYDSTYYILSRSTMPKDWVVDPKIKEFLKDPLVDTALHLLFDFLYHPLESLFNEKALSEIVPKDFDGVFDGPKNSAKGVTKAGALYSKSLEYGDMYKSLVLEYTKGQTTFGSKGLISQEKKKLSDGNGADSQYTLIDGRLTKIHKGVKVKDIKVESYWPVISGQDEKIYDALLYLGYKNPNSFAFVESADYVPGMTLLYIYLALALVLVPTSYLIVRRQDFR